MTRCSCDLIVVFEGSTCNMALFTVTACIFLQFLQESDAALAEQAKSEAIIAEMKAENAVTNNDLEALRCV